MNKEKRLWLIENLYNQPDLAALYRKEQAAPPFVDMRIEKPAIPWCELTGETYDDWHERVEEL